MKRFPAFACITLTLGFVPPPASADNLVGDYTPYPAGTRLAGLRYGYSWGGDLRARGESLDADFEYRDQQGLLSVSRYAGRSTRWAAFAALPFGRTEADSERLRLHSDDSGIGDPYMIVALWPLVRETYHLAFSGWLHVPLGSYEPGRVVNQGMNVWSAKAEANLTWRPRPAWTLELTTATRFFADNDEYGPSHATLERDPRYTVETRVVRDVRPGLRLSLDYFYHAGSETAVNGVERDDAWNDHAAQLTLFRRLGERRALTIWYRNDFVVRSGPEYQTVAVRFMQAF